MAYSKQDTALLSRHVSNLNKDIYAIHSLPPEIIAVLFAYVSRSPDSFRDNLLKLLKEGSLSSQSTKPDFSAAEKKAAAFHEKWVVGFGHKSVAEHSVCSLALENVSILASKSIEDSRLAAFTEKSTRYQLFDKSKYLKPGEIMESSFAEKYEQVMDSLFDFYTESQQKVMDLMRSKFPRSPEMSEKFYESLIKARACDVLRYALPASTLTNIGMTCNAREWEHVIVKLLSHPLSEMNSIARQMKEECSKIFPTLLKAAEKNPYIEETEKRMLSFVEHYALKPRNEKSVELVYSEPLAEEKIIASILYRYSQHSFAQCLEQAKKMPVEEKEKILDTFMEGHGNMQPLRETEHAYFTFDILVDFGAFRDIQRHRMCTQTTQLLCCDHGFSVPIELSECNLSQKFRERMSEAKELFNSMRKELPFAAQYCVPLAFKKRLLLTWNFRELWHFIKLRSGKTGHESYRRIAQQCFLEMKKKHPLLAKYLHVTMD